MFCDSKKYLVFRFRDSYLIISIVKTRDFYL